MNPGKLKLLTQKFDSAIDTLISLNNDLCDLDVMPV